MPNEKDDEITEEQRAALRAIGRKGGRTARDRHGREHYQRIGAIGGKKVRDERGHDFYVAIGKKGGARVRELLAAGRAATTGRPGDGEG